MPIYSFDRKTPVIAKSTYIAPSAVIIGSVFVGENCYVGHGVILRGDWGTIEIGNETAIEEDVFVHARPDDFTRIGNRVTLGHGSMVHNATIEDGAVIGMRAVVSDFSVVGANAIIGEMGLVKREQKIPSKKIVVGVPVKVVGDVDEERLKDHKWAKDLYVDLAKRCHDGAMVELSDDSELSTKAVAMTPIGTIHTPFKEALGTPIQGALSGKEKGEVILAPKFGEGLSDLEGFSHIVLIYAFDRMKGYKLKVKPYLDKNQRGIFATRSPCRPNPIGMTVVSLIAIDGRSLKVSGVDMLDGTPLLDIKPYVPVFDHHEETRCGWFEPHLKDLLKNKRIPVADNRFHRRDSNE